MEPERSDQPSPRTKREQDGVPRWVKVFAVVGAVIVVLVVVLLLSGHGPSRHGIHSSSTSTVSAGSRP